MRINEIISETIVKEVTRPETVDSAEVILNKAGYEYVGGGFYAKVFGKTASPYVLKLFDRSDRGYVEYVALSMSHPEIAHFPRFKGKLIRVNKEYNAIRIERLKSINHKTCEQYGFSYNYQLLGMLSRIIFNARENSMTTLMSDGDFDQLAFGYRPENYSDIPADEQGLTPEEIVKLKFEKLLNNHPELVKACYMIGKYTHPSRSIDLHDGNVMMRGNTLVITDPVSFGD